MEKPQRSIGKTIEWAAEPSRTRGKDRMIPGPLFDVTVVTALVLSAVAYFAV